MTPEFKVALVRGLFHACLVAAVAFFTVWVDPSVPTRTLVSASVLPALTVLGTRFIGEGWYDAKQAGKVQPPEPKP